MSDTAKPEKVKRPYRADGNALDYDLRVRISAKLRSDLQSYAKAKNTTPAAAARQILTDALKPDK